MVSQKRTEDAATQTDPIPDHDELQAMVDYGAYDYDCAVPVMPDIVGSKIGKRDLLEATAQTVEFQNSRIRDTPNPSLLESTLANINGIVLNIMSLGFNMVEAVLPERITTN